ncbi:MAG: universal stress protein [Deltaproteobacteria bacterium]|nr:universal stress protein [Deltaproteobacteria bacterium]MBW2009510.1 universal stress protein [Deltaproteobacteria bacterium]MBW2101057.1 universal stress protein [Deltaproteobacteria bacterium]
MAVEKILVAYNFARYERKGLDFVASTYAGRKDVKITLFNAYTPLPAVEMNGNPEMAKVRPGMASLSDELRQKESALKSCIDYLLENGFSQDQLDYVFKAREKSVADEILDMVSKGHYRVVVLSRQPTKVSRLFGRSVHSRILSSIKDVTVCVAS